MKIILVVIYASMLPGGADPEMKIHRQNSIKECNDNAALMMKRAQAGKLLAFCWKVKDNGKD